MHSISSACWHVGIWKWSPISCSANSLCSPLEFAAFLPSKGCNASFLLCVRGDAFQNRPLYFIISAGFLKFPYMLSSHTLVSFPVCLVSHTSPCSHTFVLRSTSSGIEHSITLIWNNQNRILRNVQNQMDSRPTSYTLKEKTPLIKKPTLSRNSDLKTLQQSTELETTCTQQTLAHPSNISLKNPNNVDNFSKLSTLFGEWL